MTDALDVDTGDGLDGYVPPPYEPPATLDERLVGAWRAVTRTPGRAALAVLDLGAIAGLAWSLRTITVTAADATGPIRAHCGISFYVAGAPNRAVDTACSYAFSSRMPDVLVFAVLALVATALLVASVVRPGALGRGWEAVTATPARAALAMAEGAGVVALVLAAQPVTLLTADAAGLLRARCGLKFFVLGASDPRVTHACRTAYASHAWGFVVILVLLVVGAFGLVRIARRPVVTPPPQ